MAITSQLPPFDLNNPQHLAMRRLAADVYQRHVRALSNDMPLSAAHCKGFAQGLERVSLRVLKDDSLSYICFELSQALEVQSIFHERGINA